MINRKTKLIASISAVSLSAIALIAGAWAVFNVDTEVSSIATLGTVDVSLSGLNISNPNTFLAGDNDPSVNPEGSESSHVLSYTVSNVGTKSILTRQTILLTANNNSSRFIDASYLKLFKEGKEIGDKTFVLSDGTETETLHEGDTVLAVKYVFFSDSFDGSENATILKTNEDYADFYEIETESGKKSSFIKSNSKGDVSQQYSFDLALLKDAPESYNESSINVHVCVEAIQYRETAADDWKSSARVTRSFSTNSIKIDTVPSYIEDEDGQTLTINTNN